MLSPACTAPQQPTTSNTTHPKYQEWMTYKSECSAQLVTAVSFESWLESVKRKELKAKGLLPYQIVDAHPKGEEYWTYSRKEYDAGRQPVNFEEWLDTAV